jgi:hypothetical protein
MVFFCFNVCASCKPTPYETLDEHDFLVQLLIETRELFGMIVFEKDLGFANFPVFEAEFVEHVLASLLGVWYVGTTARPQENRIALNKLIEIDAIRVAKATDLRCLQDACVPELCAHRFFVEKTWNFFPIGTYAT